MTTKNSDPEIAQFEAEDPAFGALRKLGAEAPAPNPQGDQLKKKLGGLLGGDGGLFNG